MSNPESFIDEVNEELKRDRLFAFMRKYAWLAILLVVLLVGGAAFNEWRKAQAQADARAFGDAVIAALDAGENADQVAALGAIAADGDRAGILALLRAASMLEGGDRDGAMTALSEVEANNDLPQSYRQIAALKRVIIGGDAIDLSERRNVLNGLAQPGQAFRPLALEQLALLALESGDREGALSQAEALLDEPEISDGLRRRVSQLILVLGGEQPAVQG